MKKAIQTLAVTGAVAALGVTGVVYFGLIDVGADKPHLAPVHAFLSTVRERSIEVRSRDIQVPDLDDEALIRAGAGNYDAMCVGCHLAPGVAETELSQNLYPAPPNLAKVGVDGDPAAAFWVIKHGIKATGMPAWGKSMDDRYIWEMVAFLQQLPTLNTEQYQALVTTSDGHRHGGGETEMHDPEGQHSSHEEGGSDHHAEAHPTAESLEAEASHHGAAHPHHESVPATAPKPHTHADGEKNIHGH